VTVALLAVETNADVSVKVVPANGAAVYFWFAHAFVCVALALVQLIVNSLDTHKALRIIVRPTSDDTRNIVCRCISRPYSLNHDHFFLGCSVFYIDDMWSRGHGLSGDRHFPLCKWLNIGLQPHYFGNVVR
jgi:hypothetical protein